jgi:hypothetical protein
MEKSPVDVLCAVNCEVIKKGILIISSSSDYEVIQFIRWEQVNKIMWSVGSQIVTIYLVIGLEPKSLKFPDAHDARSAYEYLASYFHDYAVGVE